VNRTDRRLQLWLSRVLVVALALALVACADSNPMPSPGQTGGPDAGGQVTTPPEGPVGEGPALDPSIFPAVGAT